MAAARSTFLPFSPPDISEEDIAEVVDTLRGGWISTGPKVKRFEEEFALAVGAPAAHALSSCTGALHVALAALGVGPGDAVLTSPMTFCATVNVVEHQGATPVLVDVEPDTLNLSAGDLRRTLVAMPATLTPKVVIPVHYGGHPCDMHAIEAVATEYGLAILEDAAHALPAAVGDTPIGAISSDGPSRAVAFSFYATKNLTTAEGGMLTGTPDFIGEARLWSLHGMSRDAWKRYGKGASWSYEVVRPGFKYNMTDIQAALGLQQLRRLGSLHARRRQLVARYREGLGDLAALELPDERPGFTHAWHLFVVRLRPDSLRIDRNRFIDELADRNIGASVHFIPVHLHPFYRDRYGFAPDAFPVATAEFERIVSLPLNTTMSDADADDVVAAVRDIVTTFAS